jgi:hypothetical protein
LDQSIEDKEEPTEFETVVTNLGSILKAKNKFMLLNRAIKNSRAFIVGDSSLKGDSSSSEEDYEMNRKLSVFFLDSDQKREKDLKLAMRILVKSVIETMEKEKEEARLEEERLKEEEK